MTVQSFPGIPSGEQTAAQREVFLDALYAGAVEAAGMSRASRSLCSLMNSDEAVAFVRDIGVARVTDVRILADSRSGAPRELKTRTGSADAELEHALSTFAPIGPDRIVCGFLGRQGDRDGQNARALMALIVTFDNRICGFAVTQTRGFSEQQKSLAWNLLRDVRRAFELQGRACAATPTAGFVEQLFADSAIGYLVTRGMALESANAAAAAMMAQERPIQSAGSLLQFENAKAQAAFERLSTGADRRCNQAALLVQSRLGGDTWLLQMTRSGDAAGDLPAAVNVAVTSFNNASSSRAAAIEGIVGLTATERAILRAIVDGKELNRVAADTGRSVRTVRWHLRNLFAKLRVHSQADLARVGSLLLPI
jgi:DNA-binding CsgD family transcriptional regulator